MKRKKENMYTAGEVKLLVEEALRRERERCAQVVKDYVRVLIYPSRVTPKEIGDSIVKIILG